MTVFVPLINDKPKPAVKPLPLKLGSRSKQKVRVELSSCFDCGIAWQLMRQSTSSITIRIASRSIDRQADPLRVNAIEVRGDCDLIWLIVVLLSWVEIFLFNCVRSSSPLSYIVDPWVECCLCWLLVAFAVVAISLLLLSWDISEHERRDDLLTLTFAARGKIIVLIRNAE